MKQRYIDVASFALVGFVNLEAGLESGWVLIPDAVSLALGTGCLILALARWFWRGGE